MKKEMVLMNLLLMVYLIWGYIDTFINKTAPVHFFVVAIIIVIGFNVTYWKR